MSLSKHSVLDTLTRVVHAPIASTSCSALALNPSDGDQGSRNIVYAPLRGKQVKLRRRVSGVKYVDADADRAEVLLRRRCERYNLGADAENQKI